MDGVHKVQTGRRAAGYSTDFSRDPARRRAVSAAVQASLRGRLWMPCHPAAAQKPGRNKIEFGRPARTAAYPSKLLRRGRRPGGAARRLTIDPRARRQPSLKPFVETEIAPGPGKTSDADIDAHIFRTALTAHHPLGTCKMGPASRCVGSGWSGFARSRPRALRVIDFSVMPDLVGGMINAPVVMIAERGADLVRGAGRMTDAAAVSGNG